MSTVLLLMLLSLPPDIVNKCPADKYCICVAPNFVPGEPPCRKWKIIRDKKWYEY